MYQLTRYTFVYLALTNGFTFPSKPPTAQLTTFYASMVNFYGDVPADKVYIRLSGPAKWSGICVNQNAPFSPGGFSTRPLHSHQQFSSTPSPCSEISMSTTNPFCRSVLSWKISQSQSRVSCYLRIHQGKFNTLTDLPISPKFVQNNFFELHFHHRVDMGKLKCRTGSGSGGGGDSRHGLKERPNQMPLLGSLSAIVVYCG